MTAPRQKGTVSGGAVLALLISSTVFVTSATLFCVWSVEQVSVAKQQHAVAELTLAAQVQARKETDARTAETLSKWRAENKTRLQQDKRATDLGYWTISPGVYFKYIDHYACTDQSKKCASFAVMTGDACPAGVAATVSMYKEGVSDSIGKVYGVTAGLSAGAVAELGVGMNLDFNSYGVTEAHCLG